MASSTKTTFVGKWGKIRAELSHAFSTTPGPEVFTTEDLALLERMADAVVKIPLKSKVESLNVAVAHGIMTYHLIHGRQ